MVKTPIPLVLASTPFSKEVEHLPDGGVEISEQREASNQDYGFTETHLVYLTREEAQKFAVWLQEKGFLDQPCPMMGCENMVPPAKIQRFCSACADGMFDNPHDPICLCCDEPFSACQCEGGPEA